MGELEVVVRRARPADEAARADLVRQGFSSHLWDAFIFFFFQELTLECCVLGGAVLFIFCGASAAACGCVVPVAAALVCAAVCATHAALAATHAQKIRKEMFGLVAEARGPLQLAPPARLALRVRLDFAAEDKDRDRTVHTQVVGTVSVSELIGPRAGGWLHGLAVHPQWRRRGIGRTLLAATRRAAVGAALDSLETAASHLQPAARALMHTHGWECRGAYARAVCGAAVTLPVARLALDLPLA